MAPSLILLVLLQFLLSTQHGQVLFAEGMLTALAYIEVLFAIVKLAHGKVQIADTTARRVRLAGNLAVLREQLTQRLDQVLKVMCSSTLYARCRSYYRQ